MLVLETGYVAQKFVNGFLHFCIFKTNLLFWNFLHKLVINIDIDAQKFQMFCVCRKKFQVVNQDNKF